MGQRHPDGDKDHKKERKDSSDKREKHKYSRPSLLKMAVTLQNIIRPNGIYPPEILELILLSMDDKTFFTSSSSCKLWMETSYQACKRLYRQQFDATIDENEELDYRAAYLQLHKAKSNLIKGVYWPEIICSRFRSRSYADVEYRFSTRNNDILCNTYRISADSYGTSMSSTQAFNYNLDALEITPHEFGCIFAGDAEVAIYNSFFGDWNYQQFFVKPTSKPSKAKLINVEPQSAEDNFIRLFKNLDGSNQVLAYHETDGRADIYGTKSGKRLLTAQFVQGTQIIAFFKNYIARRDPEEIAIVDIMNFDEVKYNCPGSTSVTHYYDGKFAYGFDDTIFLIDLETGEKIRELKVDSSALVDGEKDIEGVNGVCFDKWKLAVAFKAGYGRHVVQIFDMLHDFKLLQTIHDPMCLLDKTEISFMNNGAIVIANSNLTVYHFDHPKLTEKITAAFYDDTSQRISMFEINALDITKVATERLNLSLGELSIVTVQKPVGEDDAPPKAPSEFVSVSFASEILKKFEMRMTCIFKQQQEFSRSGFLSAVEGWPKTASITAPFALTSNEVKNIQVPLTALHGVVYRPCGFLGSCLLIFEEFDKEGERWKFCKPVFDEPLEIFRPTVKKISVDYKIEEYQPSKEH